MDDAIARGDFAALVGLREDQHFEAKGAAGYDLNTPDDRYELAKDASSFANALGGVIVAGLSNRRPASTSVDEVGGLELQPEPYFDAPKFMGVLRDHVYPSIAGLHVSWVEGIDASGMGALVIRIPPQVDDLRPFLIMKVVEAGQVVKQIVAGYAIRRGPNSVPLGPKEFQQGLRTGFSPMPQRLTRIEEKLDLLLETVGVSDSGQNDTLDLAGAGDHSLEARIRRILEDDS